MCLPIVFKCWCETACWSIGSLMRKWWRSWGIGNILRRRDNYRKSSKRDICLERSMNKRSVTNLARLILVSYFGRAPSSVRQATGFWTRTYIFGNGWQLVAITPEDLWRLRVGVAANLIGTTKSSSLAGCNCQAEMMNSDVPSSMEFTRMYINVKERLFGQFDNHCTGWIIAVRLRPNQARVRRGLEAGSVLTG